MTTPRFVSTRGNCPSVTFEDAILRGFAPDGGLYMPETVPVAFTPEALHGLSGATFAEVVTAVLRCYAGDDFAPNPTLLALVSQGLSGTPIPLHWLSDSLAVEELFHGPTGAFKDIGLQVLARLLNHSLGKKSERRTVLCATSGDTGPAALCACANLPHLRCIVLYPKGRVSLLQAAQMYGQYAPNITAVAVGGAADSDDLDKVIDVFLKDSAMVDAHNLCCINSINIGRVLTQVAFFVWGHLRAVEKNPNATVRFIIPSGGLGNATAAAIAVQMGLPVAPGDLIASLNESNDVVMQYFATGKVLAGRASATLAPAMDIACPTNTGRIDFLKASLRAANVSDVAIAEEMRRTWREHRYLLCPHTATAAAVHRTKMPPNGTMTTTTILIATAHPLKFTESLDVAFEKEVEMMRPDYAMDSTPHNALRALYINLCDAPHHEIECGSPQEAEVVLATLLDVAKTPDPVAFPMTELLSSDVVAAAWPSLPRVTNTTQLPSYDDINTIVDFEGGLRAVLKVHNCADLPQAGLLRAMDRAIRLVAAAGIHTCEPLREPACVCVSIQGTMRCVVARLHTLLPGATARGDSVFTRDLLVGAGGVAARVGLALRPLLTDCPSVAQRDNANWDLRHFRGLTPRVAIAFPDDKHKRDVLESVFLLYDATVSAHGAGLRLGAIHGDINYTNLLVADDASLGLVDYGDLTQSWIVSEPAITAAYFVMGSSDVATALERAMAVRHGYEQIASLTPGEQASYLPFVFCRIAQSVLQGAYQTLFHPENAAYLLETQGKGWAALALMEGVMAAIA